MARAEEIMRRTLKKGVSLITPEHEDYPSLLKSIYAKPAVLYVKGDISVLHDSLAIAMVGPRKNTDYGKAAAKMIAGGLAGAGAVVVSGLAPGIDTECHTAAIASGGKSVGFLGCGMDVDYPKGSAKTKRLVCESGAVVTEYPLGTKPLAGNFPIRNRLISGVSHGVVVIEAEIGSGTLITANHALEQGRDIFAVPGRIFDKTSEGTHRLISDGAKITTSVNDILEEYGHYGFDLKYDEPSEAVGDSKKSEELADTLSPPQKRPAPDGLSDNAVKIYAMLDACVISVEQIAVNVDCDISQVLSALTELEIWGLIQTFPGRRIQVCGQTKE